MESARSLWYSLLDSVCEGAITILSPVWIPSGSKFSMLQTVIQLSYRSLTTSYSISFQPFRLFSTNTCGENENAFSASLSSSSSLSQNPLPNPPKAYVRIFYQQHLPVILWNQQIPRLMSLILNY